MEDAPRNGRKERAARRAGSRGFTLVEVLVAVALFAIGMLSFFAGISFLRLQNRMASQRMLASSVAVEILELFKNQPYTDIRNSTSGSSVYLKLNPDGSTDTNWRVPEAGLWQTLPVEDVDSSSAGAPALVGNKLPGGAWQVAFQDVSQGTSPSWTVRQITVTIRWLPPTSGTTYKTLSMQTMVCSPFPNL